MTDPNTQAVVTQAMRDAILEDLRDRRLLKWLFKKDADADPHPIGYVDGPIDNATQNEIADTLASLVLAHTPPPANAEPAWMGEFRDYASMMAEEVIGGLRAKIADGGLTADEQTALLEAACGYRDQAATLRTKLAEAEARGGPPIILEIAAAEDRHRMWERRWAKLKAMNFPERYADRDGIWSLNRFVDYAGEACGFDGAALTDAPAKEGEA